jgi:hypothetical protein
MKFDLTSEEKKAISALKRIAKKWPDSLWLFSASGNLCVMRNDADGQNVMTPGGGVDQKYIVDKIEIPNDGGDWGVGLIYERSSILSKRNPC